MKKNVFLSPSSLSALRPSGSLLLAVVGCLMLGTSPIFVCISQMGPAGTGFYRLFLSLPLAYLWLVFERQFTPSKSYQAPTASDRLLLIVCGLFFGLDLALWHWSLKFTTVVNSALFNNFTAFYVSFLGWILFSERPPYSFFLALALGLTGSFLLAGESLKLDIHNLGGDLLALASALAYSGYIMSVKSLRGRLSTATLMLWSSASAGVFLFGVAFFTEETLAPSVIQDWIAVLGLALVVHIGGQGLLAYSMGQLSAVFVGFLSLLTPLIAAILAWLLFDQTLSLSHIVGGIMILTGLTLARLGESKRSNCSLQPAAQTKSSL